MRKSLFIIFSLLSTVLSAQQNKLDKYIGWKGNGIELHTVYNKQQSCTFIKGQDSIKALLLNNAGELTDEFTVPLHPKEIFRGAFIKDGKIYLYLHNEIANNFHCWLLNTADHTAKDNLVNFALKDERQLHRLNSDNYYFYLTVNKKTKEFVVYRFTDEIHFDKFSYPINENVLHALMPQILFSQSVDVQKVDMEGECDVDVAQSHNKIYVSNDSVYLIMNDSFSLSKIYTFDLVNKTTSYRVIDHQVNVTRGNLYSNNSFLAAGKLYYVAATHENLWLQIINFYSGELLKQYHANADEEISFKNTPITQESETVFNIPTNRELTKTSQLIRKMINGTAVIMATPDSNFDHTVITIGSYKLVQSAGGGGMWMPTGGAPTSMMYIPTGGFSSGSWVKSAHFKLLIDNTTNQQVAGEVSKSINDKIDDYTAGIKIPEGGDNLFRHGENYFYVYYDKKQRSIEIVKF